MGTVEDEQVEVVASIRAHLAAAENERASDRLIWQRAVKFGPLTPEEHAQGLRVALAAADEYGDALMVELGLEPPFEPSSPKSVEVPEAAVEAALTQFLADRPDPPEGESLDAIRQDVREVLEAIQKPFEQAVEERVRERLAAEIAEALASAARGSVPTEAWGEHGEESWWKQGRDETVEHVRKALSILAALNHSQDRG
ncbi:MAG TPA: hypothetical protein VMS11_01790 [Solirubrobacterales bacterium]|nr:hypothetical protein [Solirubrobacterales bacterium]